METTKIRWRKILGLVLLFFGSVMLPINILDSVFLIVTAKIMIGTSEILKISMSAIMLVSGAYLLFEAIIWEIANRETNNPIWIPIKKKKGKIIDFPRKPKPPSTA